MRVNAYLTGLWRAQGICFQFFMHRETKENKEGCCHFQCLSIMLLICVVFWQRNVFLSLKCSNLVSVDHPWCWILYCKYIFGVFNQGHMVGVMHRCVKKFTIVYTENKSQKNKVSWDASLRCGGWLGPPSLCRLQDGQVRMRKASLNCTRSNSNKVILPWHMYHSGYITSTYVVHEHLRHL